MSKIISNKTIIKGIFREISILGTQVIVETQNDNLYSQIDIGNDTDRSTNEKDTFTLTDISIKTKLINISFDLDGELYSATCKISPNSNCYLYPEKLNPNQKRKTNRLKTETIARSPLIAEVRGYSWRAYGFLKDLNNSHVVVNLLSLPSEPKINDFVKIKLYSSQHQAADLDCYLQYFRQEKDGSFNLIFKMASQASPQKGNRFNHRILTDNNSPNLKLYWPDLSGLEIKIKVTNVGVFGFSGLINDNDRILPPAGSICILGESKLKAKIAWLDQNKIGLDLRTNTRPALEEWCDLIEKWTQKSILDIPTANQQKQLLSIMFRSGYLRGKKGKQYTNQLFLKDLIPMHKETRSWLKRHTESLFSVPDTHVSFNRLSDSSWMLQEVASSAQTANIGSRLVSNALSSFFAKEAIYSGLNSTVIALVDTQSSFTNKFWLSKANEKNSIVNPAILIDISGTDAEGIPKMFNNLKFELPTLDHWDSQYTELVSSFSKTILNVFGLSSNTYESLLLKTQLIGSGYLLERKVFLITNNSNLCGVLVSFGLPTFSNLTATANHFWCLVKSPDYISSILQYIRENPEIRNQLNGVTESIFISHEKNINFEEIKNIRTARTRLFKLVTIPILKIPNFLGKTNE